MSRLQISFGSERQGKGTYQSLGENESGDNNLTAVQIFKGRTMSLAIYTQQIALF